MFFISFIVDLEKIGRKETENAESSKQKVLFPVFVLLRNLPITCREPKPPPYFPTKLRINTYSFLCALLSK